MSQILIETTILCNGLVLPLIYFTNPLTITEDLKQMSLQETAGNNSFNSVDKTGLVFNLSKGISEYEAWLKKEEEAASKIALIELLDSLTKESLNFYDDDYYEDSFTSKEDNKVAEKALKSLKNKRLCKSNSKVRKSRIQSKKAFKKSLIRRFPVNR